ncbi:RHS repeat-associated core domain-containing protein [Chryseobacterium sp. C39-AII1]|uniref:RHS repeat domain-containing protein n=1 Tax=Chryseobacterium sp. C39-AII1 TaxID=3080332 RepID=UPI003208F05E
MSIFLYQKKDYLVNTRISFSKTSEGVQVRDTNNYYPFGLNHIGGSNASNFGSLYSYKYNGKELQETGMYDFGARMYMPDLARWGVVDALAEQMRRYSPYNYAFNNPLRFIDPDGNAAYDPRSIYGEHSAFNGDFDPNSTLSSFSGMSNSLANYFAPDAGGGQEGSGSLSGGAWENPSFQFPKNKEEYYKKNYPAFYDFVMNILPNIINDINFMSVLSETSGFSIEELTKMFSSQTNYGIIFIMMKDILRQIIPMQIITPIQ